MMEQGLPGFLDSDFLRKLENLHLVAKRLSWPSAKGEHPASRKGFSLEFSDYRRYHAGDDLRYVDWNVYRRLGKPFVKVFTAEEDLNIYLLLDASASMAEGKNPKTQYAKSVAAALGYIGLKNLDRVGCMGFSAEMMPRLPLGRGRKQILALFSFLERLSCRGETDLRGAAKSFSLSFPRQGLVILLSDLFDPTGYRDGLEELIRKKYDLLVIHIVDEAEIRLTPQGDADMVDVESLREKPVFLDSHLTRRFNEEMARYLEEAESFCLNRGVEYLRTTTATPFEDFVLVYLRRGVTVK